MTRTGLKMLLAVLVSSSILSLAVGCSSNSNSPSATVSTSATNSPSVPTASGQIDIPAIAGPIAENILVALGKNDYAAFSKDFSQAAKNTLNQTAFEQLYSQTQSAIGAYQSKLFFTDTTQSGTVTVVYLAKYSKEPAGVSVTLVLQAVDARYEVQGLSLDSPNLRGQPVDVQKLRAYADPKTENVLLSLNNNDYAGFSKDLDQAVKNAIPATGFNGLYNQIKSTVGDYQSKEFEGASVQNNIITALYLAQYSSEPAGVWVSISFDSSQEVAGLYFTSPKLRQAQQK
jgi:Protein of unknown function (DUF3887)